MIVLMVGLPGSGKSTLARRLAEELPAVVLDKDRVRAALFPAHRVEYAAAQDELCYQVMLQTAQYLLLANRREPVIFDGRTFSRHTQRLRAAELAAEVRVPLRTILCVCSDETARRRLARDAALGRHLAANRSFELYLEVKARFEALYEPHLLVDSDAPLEQCVARVLGYLRG